MIEIPLRGDLDSYTFEVEMAGSSYTLRLDWNTRSSRWEYSIYDGETPVVAGLALVTNYPLTRRFPQAGLPNGTLMLFNTLDVSECNTKDGVSGAWALLFEPEE